MALVTNIVRIKVTGLFYALDYPKLADRFFSRPGWLGDDAHLARIVMRRVVVPVAIDLGGRTPPHVAWPAAGSLENPVPLAARE